MEQKKYDVIIVGAGLAGLSLALMLMERKPDIRIAVVAKHVFTETNSFYAQGGIAASLDNQDNLAQHVKDTVIASSYSADIDVVSAILSHSHDAISWLIKQGVQFDKNGDTLHLTQEGGHTTRRILHIADHTGSGIMQVLWSKVQDLTNIDIVHDQVIELIVHEDCCYGVVTIKNHKILASKVVLATGGLGQIYPYTTNPLGATGDGIALAQEAGAKISDLEFIQFHPTVLYNSGGFLISEAMRGEGAILYNIAGTRFMQQYDDRLELAPRDIVSRAIYDQIMQETQSNPDKPYVLLDISHKPAEVIIEHFPNIYQKCLELGFDITKQPIPVVPAAHYSCGGIDTDLNAQTSIKHLYAIGECANTGLHRANRLASNSLLECVIMATQCMSDILKKDLFVVVADNCLNFCDDNKIKYCDSSDDKLDIKHIVKIRNQIQALAWQYLGILRSISELDQLFINLTEYKKYLGEITADSEHSYEYLLYYHETMNIIRVIELVAQAVRMRPESLGTHFVI